MKYLDSVALAKLGGLRLQLRRITTDGGASGRHRSLARGASHDFSQHRPYAPGDEIKALDWKLYARHDRFFVREYNEEALLGAHILLDVSGSMGFSSSERGKWDHACRLAMAFAYLVIAGGDAAGLAAFDHEMRFFFPPRSAMSHLELMDEELRRLKPGGETDISRVIEQAAARIKRRSLIILVSDLLGDAGAVLNVLKALKTRRHELVVLQVLDPMERDFDYSGPTVFQGLEGGVPLSCDASLLASEYRKEFEKTLRLYAATFHRSDIAYAAFYTDRPWDAGLGRFLSWIR